MKIPAATYRLQFHPGFQFEHANEIAGYLKQLGVSDLYSSPLLQARSGSGHGYDVTNPSQINSQLGGEEEFLRLSQTLQEQGLGLILDIVPNHMAASEENPWWRDVLEKGTQSPFAHFFDVNWEPLLNFLQGKVMLPLLGEPFGTVLEKGQLRLMLAEGQFSIGYWDRRFPLSLPSYPELLEYNYSSFEERLGVESPSVQALGQLIRDFRDMEIVLERDESERYLPDSRVREIKRRLKELYDADAEVQTHINEMLESINGQSGIAGSFDMLEELINQQTYRLSFWKIAGEEINYRRFFNISDLICLCQEKEKVFEQTHRLILRLIREGHINGVRIDHVDGLYDPLGYLGQLQETICDTYSASKENPFYIVVEKILCEDELLPEDWPVAGTSGYEFMTQLGGLFLDKDHVQALDDVYAWVLDESVDFETMVYDKKKLVMSRLFAGEVRRLRERLSELAKHDRHARDLPISQVGRAFIEVTACLPVYRNYAREYSCSPRDSFYVDFAVNEAKKRTPALSTQALEFIRKVLKLEIPSVVPAHRRKQWLDLVLGWQQFTGPLMAKGLEDTTFYIYNRLISLNDVGGDPSAQTLSLEQFHEHNQRKCEKRPHSMNASSTHDTKRSEDVRARIHVLSEMPETWQFYLKRWFELNEGKKSTVRRQRIPDANKEYMLYQTLIGFWPNDEPNYEELIGRLKDYLIKASREAKVHTSWMRPDEAHEKALHSFVDQMLDISEENEFLQSFLAFQSSIAFYGAINSLSQVVLKITSPGVPDLYQGTELWDFSLVDPDNRRPVDFEKRQANLNEIQERSQNDLHGLRAELLEHWKDGRIKLFTLWKTLQLRNDHLLVFQEGNYAAHHAEGPQQNHICAFSRMYGNDTVLVVIPRLLSTITPPNQWPLGETVWNDTILKMNGMGSRTWHNIFTDERISADETMKLSDLFCEFPLAVLVNSV